MTQPVFQVKVNDDDSKIKEQFWRISDRLYHQKRKRSVGNRIFLVWWGLIVVSYIFMFSEPGIISVLLIAVWCLALSRRLRRKALLNIIFAIGRIRRMFGKRSLVRSRIDFYDNEFTMSPSKEALIWKYPVVDKLAEDTQAYYIFFARETGLFFSKRCFTAGNSQDFKSFITQKTGREITVME